MNHIENSKSGEVDQGKNESLLSSLRCGAIASKDDFDRAVKNGGFEVRDDFMSSSEAVKAVKDGVVSLISINSINDATKMMSDFGITREAVIFELAVNEGLSRHIAGEIYTSNIDNLKNMEQVFGEGYLKHVPVIGEIKNVLNGLIIKKGFDVLSELESLGISRDDIEDSFIDVFVKSFQLLGDFSKLKSEFFEKLQLTDRFYKHEGVIGTVKQLCFFSLESGNLDEFKKIVEDFQVELDQDQFAKHAGIYTRKLEAAGSAELEGFRQKIKDIGFSDDFMDEGYSEKVAIKEGFVESKDIDGPRAAVFSAMKEGEYKLLHYPSGDVSQRPELQGYVHTILYKSAGGKKLEKTLSKNELGWTKFAAQSLVDFLSKESKDNKSETPSEFTLRKDVLVKQNGFVEVGATQISGSRLAIFKNLQEGQLVTLAYPDGEIANDGMKKGYVHTVIYKDSYGRFYQKQLNDDKYKNGWTEFEANSLVKGIEDSQG